MRRGWINSPPGGVIGPVLYHGRMPSDSGSIVHSDPGIPGGTPVSCGTRVPVRTLFNYLEGCETLDWFLDQFASVSRAQALAALELARDSVRIQHGQQGEVGASFGVI